MKHDGQRKGERQEEGKINRNDGEKKEGAKTFRRKRAILFLEHLETKKEVLKKQLESPELQTVKPIIVGELKATEAIIAEFVHMFELYEFREYFSSENTNKIKLDKKI